MPKPERFCLSNAARGFDLDSNRIGSKKACDLQAFFVVLPEPLQRDLDDLLLVISVCYAHSLGYESVCYSNKS